MSLFYWASHESVAQNACQNRKLLTTQQVKSGQNQKTVKPILTVNCATSCRTSEQPPTGWMILEKIFLARGNLLRNVKNFWQKNLKKKWLVRNKYQKNQMRSSPKKVRWKTCSANFIASFFITRFWELCFFKQSLAFSLCLNQFLLNYLFCNDFSVIKNDTMITKERNRRCGNQQIRPSSTF